MCVTIVCTDTCYVKFVAYEYNLQTMSLYCSERKFHLNS